MDRAYRVVGRPEILPDDRDFGARFNRVTSNGTAEYVLEVPIRLLPLLVERKVEDTRLLYALVTTDPRAVAKAMGWTVDQVAKAKNGLHSLLERAWGLPGSMELLSVRPPAKASVPAPSKPPLSWAPPPPQHHPSSFPPRRRRG